MKLPPARLRFTLRILRYYLKRFAEGALQNIKSTAEKEQITEIRRGMRGENQIVIHQIDIAKQ